MFVDSHCHLNFPDFKDDLPDVIKNAKDKNISCFLTINTKLYEMRDLLKIVETYDHVFSSVGVHPHEVKTHDLKTIKEQLLIHTHHPKVVGIGETGLDYFYEHSPKQEQIESFEQHISTSLKTNLPLIIHTRNADDDTINILKKYKGEAKGVFHCFSGDRSLASNALDLGYYISFSGIITFKKAEDLRELVKYVPLDRILIETDAPYLAPTPHRGKRNEPSFVIHTAEMVAELKDQSLETIGKETTHNFFALFSKAHR